MIYRWFVRKAARVGWERLSARFPRLRFEVEDVIVEGGPWSTRVATRYAAVQDGRLMYRGAQFAWPPSPRNGFFRANRPEPCAVWLSAVAAAP